MKQYGEDPLIPKAPGNPYQELLYAPMREKGDQVRYLALPTRSATFNVLTFIPQLVFWRLCGYDIFHLHWVDAFETPLKWFAYRHYRLCLATMRCLRYKLVWTAHNALPHEPVFPDDIAARRALIGAADLVITHTAATIKEFRAMGMQPKRHAIIPHGNYIDAYPRAMTRTAARTALGLRPEEFVYLYLGQVREYKGVDLLLCAHTDLRENRGKLIIAGKCRDEELKKKLLTLGTPADVLWHEQFIDDGDLQTYFAAADVVVLPFEKITTSGSALLALSFGKAVIVPRLGDMAQLPDTVSYKYPPGDENGLLDSMRQAAEGRDTLRKRSEAAFLYAKRFNWPSIAAETHNAIKALFTGKNRPS